MRIIRFMDVVEGTQPGVWFWTAKEAADFPSNCRRFKLTIDIPDLEDEIEVVGSVAAEVEKV